MWSKPRARLLRLVTAQPERNAPTDPLAAIVEGARSGDRVAVRTFLVTAGPHLLRSVRRVLGASHHDVDDVVQESAFALLEALPRFRGESTVLHFVCRVAALTAVNARRRHFARKRTAERADALDPDSFTHPGPRPDAALEQGAAVALVRELVDSLPLAQAEVLTLHVILGCTLPEIAEDLGAPLETVRSRLRLAKQALRERVLGDLRMHDLLEPSS